MDTLLRDLAHSFRVLRRQPAFALTAIAALGLGIGANTAIFSVVNRVLLRPLPFPEPERLVYFGSAADGGFAPIASPAKFAAWRQLTDIAVDISATRSSQVNYTGGDVPQQLQALQVSANFFALLGLRADLGRGFSPEEDLPGGPKAVVLSHNFWRTRLASDPAAIGKTLLLSGNPHVVVGVLSRTANVSDLAPAPDVYTAFQLDPNSTEHAHYFQVVGRLAPGLTMERANARAQVATDEFRQRFPQALQDQATFGVRPMRESLVAGVRTTLFVLLGAVGFVLLIACANVASLLLARATGRRREIAVRAAMGAGRGRLMRQFVTESMVLAVVGGAVGLALGIVGIRAILAINTAGLPAVGAGGSLVSVDWRVLTFTALATLGTGLLFGILPAVSASRWDLNVSLSESGGRGGSGFGQNRARAVLVVAEVALAVVLVIGSSLMIRTAVALAGVNPGFDPSHVLTMRVSFTEPRFRTTAGLDQVIRTATERVRAVPGVEVASATCCVPLQGGLGLGFTVVGRPLEAGQQGHGGGGFYTVAPGYFDAFKIPIKRGRDFNERDAANTEGVIIINEAMARQYWPNGDPLTDRLAIARGMKAFDGDPERRVIGIVGDVRDGGLNSEPGPAMYVPYSQLRDAVTDLNSAIMPVAWVTRTRGPSATASEAVANALREATGLPVSGVQTMDDIVSGSTSRQRFNMWLMTGFGGLALVLAAIGIYGLLAYSVAQRTREIGIRVALGAQPAQVRRMVVREGMRLAAVGLGLGLIGAVALTRYLETLLYSVRPRDPLTFAAVPAILAAVAVAAAWLPARRASTVDPIEALRVE